MKRPNGTRRNILLAGILLLAASAARAGWHDAPTTVQITNPMAVARDAKTATVRFDLTWHNSWRHEGNYDAIWVFFKVRPEGSTEWQPVRLVADRVLNPTGYGQPVEGTPVDFIVPAGEDGFTGMFVRRAELGQGTVKATQLTAVWDVTANTGIEKVAKAEITACGVEMVYVPEGAFNLGSGGTQTNTFFMYTDGGNSDTPYRVTGPGAIPTGKQKGRLWATGAEPEDGGEIPALFPNGYAAFFCMKCTISGGQYAAFLNTIPRAEAEKRYSRAILCSGQPTNVIYSCDADREIHNMDPLSWMDGAAWANWAGLRPMTEMEYEKVSRGEIEPGWDMGCDLSYGSYWGIWNCNAWKSGCDHPVTVANAKGRSFRGTHGRGTAALPADWPQEDAVGACSRGGWTYRHPSCREGAASMSAARENWQLWRGVRTAPKEAGNR